MQRSLNRLARSDAALAIVDMQERLLSAMFERDRLLRKTVQLVRGCAILDVPIVATEQNPRGLGPTVKEAAEAAPSLQPIEKFSFSSCGAPLFMRAIKAKGASQVLLCGIESHVCVTQTCLDLRQESYGVFVVADATSSRSSEDWRYGIERMRDAGAVVVSVEMALFELLGGADKPEFKQILGLVK